MGNVVSDGLRMARTKAVRFWAGRVAGGVTFVVRFMIMTVRCEDEHIPFGATFREPTTWLPMKIGESKWKYNRYPAIKAKAAICT